MPVPSKTGSRYGKRHGVLNKHLGVKLVGDRINGNVTFQSFSKVVILLYVSTSRR